MYNIFRGNYYVLYLPPEARYIYEDGILIIFLFRVYQDSTVPAALTEQIHPRFSVIKLDYILIPTICMLFNGMIYTQTSQRIRQMMFSHHLLCLRHKMINNFRIKREDRWRVYPPPLLPQLYLITKGRIKGANKREYSEIKLIEFMFLPIYVSAGDKSNNNATGVVTFSQKRSEEK